MLRHIAGGALLQPPIEGPQGISEQAMVQHQQES
jgi:hypothetical protein